MTFPEYSQHDGLGLAQLVASGQISAAELLTEALRRLERHNPQLNAVVYRADERAAKWAQNASKGPFQGVPLLLKDILGTCQGMPTRMASRSIPERIGKSDAELVARYRRAGFVPFGKTNAPEFGLLPITDSGLYGPAKNPWNLELTTGGSSGGAAAAVAAGIVPVAHGNDGGGSLRIPAACCGVVGLKPTRGRNSLAPGSDPSGLVCEHVLTRTIRDSAAALDATAGSMPGDYTCLPAPAESFLSALDKPLSPLRIAVIERDPRGEPYAPECQTALQATADELQRLGHHVSVAQPHLSAALLSHAFFQVWYANAAVLADGLALLQGSTPLQSNYDPLVWCMIEEGRKLSSTDYQSARFVLDSTSRRIALFMQPYDVVLSPTLTQPAPTLGHIDIRSNDLAEQMKRSETLVGYAPIANASGMPALSLPLHMTPAGVPIGMHFMAAACEEALLLRLGRQLELAMPWHDRHPAGFHE